MTQTQHNKELQSPEAKQVSTDVSTSGANIQIYTNTIALQPLISSPSFPHLKTHITHAKANAKVWTSQYHPRIFQSLTNIIDYGNQFQRYYPKLHKAAENADDPHFREQLIGGMDRLKKKVVGFGEDAKVRKKDIVTFYDKLNEDHVALKADLDAFERKLSSENTIKNLKDRIKALEDTEDSISDTITELWVGFGAATTAAAIGGVLVFTGIGAIVMGGSIYGAVEAKEEIDNMEKQLEEVVKSKAAAQAELDRINRDVAFATRYKDSLEKLVLKSSTASRALTSEMNCWDLLGQAFGTVEDGLKKADIESFFIAEDLAAANDNWEGAVRFAETMRTNQALPVKTKKLGS